MKQEPCFKYLAAALLVGVLLAFLSPAPAAQPASVHAATNAGPAAAASAKS